MFSGLPVFSRFLPFLKGGEGEKVQLILQCGKLRSNQSFLHPEGLKIYVPYFHIVSHGPASKKSNRRTKTFGDRTGGPYGVYTRKHREIEPDQRECARCESQFGLFTLSWLKRTRFDLPEIL